MENTGLHDASNLPSLSGRKRQDRPAREPARSNSTRRSFPGNARSPAGPGLFILFLFLCPLAVPADDSLSLKETQLLKLLGIKAIYVDPLNGAESAPIRDLLIGSLHRTGLFLIVEDEDRADAFLRGSAEDLIYSTYYRTRGGFNVRSSSSDSHRESGESDFISGSIGVREDDSFSRRNRKHEAMAAVRLVLRNGDVVWSTTQESSGGKYKGAAADVTDKVAEDLVEAYRWAEKVRRKVNAPAVLEPPLKAPHR